MIFEGCLFLKQWSHGTSHQVHIAYGLWLLGKLAGRLWVDSGIKADPGLVLLIFPFLRRNPYIKSISWNAPPINSRHKNSNVVADA